MTITRSSFPRQLEEGINAAFGMRYDRHPPEWSQLFTEYTSDKPWEEDVKEVGFGAAPEKAEGAPLAYDEAQESYIVRYVHRTVAMGFRITEEAEEDNLYGGIARKCGEMLAVAMLQTKEVNAANVFNNGFDSNFPGGDGQPLFSTSHPLAGGGTLANTFTAQADLSEASLEAAVIEIAQWTDDRGIPVNLQTRKLAIPTSLQFVAHRILGSEYRVKTGDNDINAMYSLGTIPDGICVIRRFTDQNAWYLLTDCPDGFKHFTRVGMQRGMEGDFETGNLRYKARERYSEFYSDWRAAYGSSGSA